MLNVSGLTIAHGRIRFIAFVAMLIATVLRPGVSLAQMVVGEKMTHFADAFGTDGDHAAKNFTAVLAESNVPANILWPGEQPTWTIQLQNEGGTAIKTAGKIDVVHYGTRGAPGDVWDPVVFKFDDAVSVPIEVDLPAHGVQNVNVSPKLPETFGGYGIVADLGSAGRKFVFTTARMFKPSTERLQFPSLSLDDMPGDTLPRIGIQAIRHGVQWAKPGDKNYDKVMAQIDTEMKSLWDKKITCLLMVDAGDHPEPLGRPRPHLDANGVMTKGKSDMAWLPSEDDGFQEWVKVVCSKYGWPKGPATAMSLWNEPWEGVSISGWGADMLRYREIYRHMAAGVLAARSEANVQVLVGGCDSSSNAMDKLFCDDSSEFLPIFDFVSVHYQGMSSPAIYKMWRDRTGPMGRVKVWDTESWVANCDDRVAALVAANKSAGYDRALGVYKGNVSDVKDVVVKGADGKAEKTAVTDAWSTAASVSAAVHFIGQRPYSRLLFQNGLPWVMVFDGVGADGKPNVDDGTIVVVGDLGEEFQKDLLLHRTIHSTRHLDEYEAATAKLASMPTDAPAEERATLVKQIRELTLVHDATMTVDNPDGKFKLYDFYGNPVDTKGGPIVVPLDGRGFFLRSDGTPGSFDALTKAVTDSKTEGFECAELIAHDLLAPIESHPSLKITITNVLNRPISGTLAVTLGSLQLEAPGYLSFAAGETRDVDLKVTGGSSVESNVYPVSMKFDAGADGFSRIKSDLHVNVIARRTINVDGNLDDWKGVLPQTILSDTAGGATMQEKAWFPFMKYDSSVKKGQATGYLAYDDNFFYFAAKVADSTPDGGTLRFENRDDDQFFYPEKSFAIGHTKELDWPEDVRKFSYRRMYILPAGSSPSFDNILIAFNAIPADKDPIAYDSVPGSPPEYTCYRDTDYQFALNKVADKYGGGTEIWRLEVPDHLRKHFFPVSPKHRGKAQ